MDSLDRSIRRERRLMAFLVFPAAAATPFGVIFALTGSFPAALIGGALIGFGLMVLMEYVEIGERRRRWISALRTRGARHDREDFGI
ncbi:hypothetical protein DSD19_04510 [Rhodovulum sp. BSW8]|uniref:hypothetical protein n=1 Tax=Rhodovulum sp. BSW8 TaxID=2259645 RepID=UPI000DE26ECD|nr:hypothetical protein [Rhodovulum sp. BSW8]RBO54644.1 hypothetical protein DSD19_04510 [Rhodovulum sp. BSW8]